MFNLSLKNFGQSGNQPNPENLVESTEDVELDDAALMAVNGGQISYEGLTEAQIGQIEYDKNLQRYGYSGLTELGIEIRNAAQTIPLPPEITHY